MEKIVINTQGKRSEIVVGEKWTGVAEYLSGKEVYIITDDNVRRLYGPLFPGFPVLTIRPGEESKTLEEAGRLASLLLNAGAGRSGFILAIGGGVVCDLAGFVASVYMRGVPFGFVSTSLLSQVDASVGGKNGVNLGRVKNIIGTFSQPEFVICDPEMLTTLDSDEYLSGLAELIKTGIILDSALLDKIEKNRAEILAREPMLMTSLIARSVTLKAGIVSEDEREKGRRMILNFGHTFGHVIEAAAGHKHGFAVASGMLMACGISVAEGLLPPSVETRIHNILKSYDLIRESRIDISLVRKLLIKDKKRSGETINFVMITSPGNAVVKGISPDKLIEYYSRLSDLL